ncbi:MAG: isoprenylcysteine carboxylmethyltransferase family protein [Nitrospirae bacterium]|nr:isoprenylcysteine carboxylmethyltransferase family protein [Nitrospirota bacterium]
MLYLRAIVAALAVPGTTTIIAPWLLLRAGWGRFDPGFGRYAALPALLIGAAGLIWCIADFARKGRGTLVPIDPPKFLVRGGLYRCVRNPMYLSVLITVASESFVFGSLPILIWAAALAVAFNLFVLLYEEPHLRRQFGADYETYCREVPRWLLRPPTKGTP